MQINEANLVGMIKGFREYKALIEPIAADQKEMKPLLDHVNGLINGLTFLTRLIYRKYDHMNDGQFFAELDHLIKKSKK